MKVARSLVPRLIMGVMLLSLVILAAPPAGFAQNPHACTNFTTHMGSSLGGVTTYQFQFARNCNGYYSYATTWQFIIQDVTNPTNPITVCSAGWAAVPSNGQATLDCNNVLKAGDTYKVVINFTVPPNTLMTHTHTVSN
jgi:hypothetical protein